MMRAETLRQRPALRGLVVGLGIALAWVLGAIGLQRNLQRACELREWPELSSCPVRDEAVPAQVRDLRARIAANPGDSAAWLALALLTSQPGGVAPLDDAAVLATASRMAPQDPLLQRLQVSRALQREQWTLVVPGLVRLVQEQDDGGAMLVLAALVARPQARDALLAAVQPGTTWLEPVLRHLDAAGVPAVLAMPLAWLDQWAADGGHRIEELVHGESQQQAADQVSISNSIGSLRFLAPDAEGRIPRLHIWYRRSGRELQCSGTALRNVPNRRG